MAGFKTGFKLIEITSNLFFQVRLVDAKDLNFTSLKVFGQDASDIWFGVFQ